MTKLVTASLKKKISGFSPDSTDAEWHEMVLSHVQQYREDIADIMARFSEHIEILSHQRARCQEIVELLEECGGLTVRARNMAQMKINEDKRTSELSLLEIFFKTALQKIDAVVAGAEFKGVNLLNGGTLSTALDSDKSVTMDTMGMGVTVKDLEIHQPDFSTLFTIQNSRVDVMNAMDMVVTLRNIITANAAQLKFSLEFADKSCALVDEVSSHVNHSNLENELFNLLKLKETNAGSTGDEPLADAAQQEILEIFLSDDVKKSRKGKR